MLGLKLNHVNKMGPGVYVTTDCVALAMMPQLMVQHTATHNLIWQS